MLLINKKDSGLQVRNFASHKWCSIYFCRKSLYLCFCTATYIMIPDGQYDKLKSINHYAKSDTIHADFFSEKL